MCEELLDDPEEERPSDVVRKPHREGTWILVELDGRDVRVNYLRAIAGILHGPHDKALGFSGCSSGGRYNFLAEGHPL